MDERTVYAGNTKKGYWQALAYSIERWDKLCRYTKDGMLNIDNNPVENSICPVAIGRKNYLFVGSHETAKRSAMLYSLIETCKMHGIETFGWQKNVLEKKNQAPPSKKSKNCCRTTHAKRKTIAG